MAGPRPGRDRATADQRRHRLSEATRQPRGHDDAPMRTQLCDALGMEYPIFAFSHCRDVVAAITNAGGFGVFGALGPTPSHLDDQLRWIDEQARGRPYGVDIVLPARSLEDD